MARRNVVTTPMYTYTRKAPTGEFLGWGSRATRKATNEISSPKLIAHQNCMARLLSGKTGSLKTVQENFQKATAACKANKQAQSF